LWRVRADDSLRKRRREEKQKVIVMIHAGKDSESELLLENTT